MSVNFCNSFASFLCFSVFISRCLFTWFFASSSVIFFLLLAFVLQFRKTTFYILINLFDMWLSHTFEGIHTNGNKRVRDGPVSDFLFLKLQRFTKNRSICTLFSISSSHCHCCLLNTHKIATATGKRKTSQTILNEGRKENAVIIASYSHYIVSSFAGVCIIFNLAHIQTII